MVYEPRPLKIKNFGNDLLFRSVEELKETLKKEFKGKDTLASGPDALAFLLGALHRDLERGEFPSDEGSAEFDPTKTAQEVKGLLAEIEAL